MLANMIRRMGKDSWGGVAVGRCFYKFLIVMKLTKT